MKFLLDLLRGMLIGTAEVIPGVSGGTVALIVGRYERIIDSAAAASKAMGFLLSLRFGELPAQLRKIDFKMLLPLLVGMFSAVFLAAALLEPLLKSEPEVMRGLFFGMILVSLIVPYRMVADRWLPGDYLLALLAAGLSFGLLSLPRGVDQDPTLLVVFLAAAIAVCALVLPGVSGSFLLLTLGLYAPTIAAVNERDFAYLGIFILGAIVGLAVFSNLLSWLLTNQHRITLIIMTGLMLGSLRAIWPWQTPTGGLLPPTSLEPPLALILGAGLVIGIMVVEAKIKKAQ